MVVSLIAAAVLAVPMQISGTTPHYPRLTRFPDAAVMAKVNADLAAKEKQNQADYRDCLSGLRDIAQKPDKDTWSVAVSVTYLSARFMSVNAVVSNYCGGAYPNDGIQTPVTFDLSTGKEIDWKAAFKPSFFSGALTRLYRASYPKSADAECRKTVTEQDPFETADGAIFRLETGKGLVVLPDLPHVVQACAEEVTLPAARLAPFLADARMLAELRAVGSRQ
jgi:hypothetical protein